MSAVSYTPLDLGKKEIRILEIHRGQPATPIQCSLSTVVLNESVKYDALSYVWGDDVAPDPIFISGQPTRVTRNLEEALRHLRREDQSLVIWIDTLCINQAETRERNHQVAMMGDIYRQAQHVFAWVGLAEADMDGMERLVDTFKHGRDLHWDPSLTPAGPAGVVERVHLETLSRFLSRPWWTRVWTVQEAILARGMTFVYGTHRMALADLAAAGNSFLHHVHSGCCRLFLDPLDPADGAKQDALVNAVEELAVLQQVRGSRDTVPFSHKMSYYRLRSCHEPKDKIYGTLGFGDSTPMKALRPDYAASDKAAYEQVALAVLDSRPDLYMLGYVLPEQARPRLASQSRVPDLPSWVPDWTVQVPVETIRSVIMYRHALLDLYRASGARSRFMAHALAGKLALRGVLFGTVGTVGPARESAFGRHDAPLAQEWRRMARVDEDPSRLYRRGGRSAETVYDAFWQVLTSALDYESFRNMDIADCVRVRADDVAKGRAAYDAAWAWFTASTETHAEDRIRLFIVCMHISTGSRRFFLSTPGEDWMGMAPLAAQPGDRLAVLDGGNVPYILRPHGPADKNEWTFVGDAYVHGAMDGEALDLGPTQDITLV